MTLWAREDYDLDVVVVSFEPIGNTRVAFSGRCWLLGWSATETTGVATATVKLLDGLDANGKALDRIVVQEGMTSRWNPGQPGTPCNHGLFVNMISGTVDLYLTIGRWVSSGH